MLRVGGGAPQAQDTPPNIQAMPEPDADEQQDQEPDQKQECRVNPIIAMYRDPSQGPFACGNCVHMIGFDECDIVAGPIDPDGLCNLFESTGGGGQQSNEAETQPEEPPAQAPPQG